MPDETSGQSLLENAYRLATPADSVAYYRAFAATYDSDFAAQLGWFYPKAIAAAYRAAALPGDLAVADIGCGTGWVARELGLPRAQVDGMDISAEMLAVAQAKRLYRRLFRIDLTGGLGPVCRGYGAVLSAGTFTHGHLGPEPLRRLTAIARPGGLFVIGVNERHHAGAGFGPVLAAMQAAGEIGPVSATATPMYSTPGHAHSGDRALILTYRRL